jgi:hypothetical protein
MGPRFYYCVRKSHQLIPILSQINPLHNLMFYFFKVHFNIILPSKLQSSNFLLISNFLTKILYTFYISPIRAFRPAHFALCNDLNLSIYIKANVCLCVCVSVCLCVCMFKINSLTL